MQGHPAGLNGAKGWDLCMEACETFVFCVPVSTDGPDIRTLGRMKLMKTVCLNTGNCAPSSGIYYLGMAS